MKILLSKKNIPIDISANSISILACCFCIVLASDGWADIYGLVFPYISDYLELEKALSSIITAFLYSVPLFFSPFALILVQMIGSRKQILYGCLIMTFSLVLPACLCSLNTQILEVNYVVMYICLGVTSGIGLSLLVVTVDVSISNYFTKGHSFAQALANCGMGLAGVLFPFPFKEIIKHHGWRIALYLPAAVFASCILTYFGFAKLRTLERTRRAKKIKRNRRIEKGLISRARQGQTGTTLNTNCSTGSRESIHHISTNSTQISSTSVTQDFRKDTKNYITAAKRIVKHTSFMIFLLGQFVYFIFMETPYQYLPQHAQDVRKRNIEESKQKETNFEEYEESVYVVCLAVFGCLGVLTFGYLGTCDKLIPIHSLLSLTQGCSGIPMMLFGLDYTFKINCVLCGVYSFLQQSTWALQTAIVRRLLPHDFEEAYGMLCCTLGFGQFIGPVIIGRIKDKQNSLNTAFLVSGATEIIAGFIMGIIPLIKKIKMYRRKQRRRRKQEERAQHGETMDYCSDSLGSQRSENSHWSNATTNSQDTENDMTNIALTSKTLSYDNITRPISEIAVA